MAKDSRNRSSDEDPSTEEATSLETVIRRRARGLIDAIVEEELEAMLGAAPSARVGILRQGYRHGTRERTLTTSLGPTTSAMPDGSAGLAAALREQWPSLAIQRCTAHKLRNLEAKAPVRLREELADDLCGDPRARRSGARPIHEEVAAALSRGRSLQEADDDLFTFLSFPKAQWKALRTTNALERINGEFRRRTKTQASLPSQDAVLLLLFGLLRSGQVKMRKIDGWHEMQRATQAA